MNYSEICRKVIALDALLRFAAIANSDGKIVAAVVREGTTPLLTREESELSIMQSVIRMSIRKTLESKLGKTLYAVAVYEKITRATISLFSDDNKHDVYLLVSLDATADFQHVIVSKILPFLAGTIKPMES